jgi:hypothetical protein
LGGQGLVEAAQGQGLVEAAQDQGLQDQDLAGQGRQVEQLAEAVSLLRVVHVDSVSHVDLHDLRKGVEKETFYLVMCLITHARCISNFDC